MQESLSHKLSMPSGQAAHLESRAPTWDMLLSTPHPFPGRRKGLASRTPCLGEPGPADTQVALRLQSEANGVRPSQLAIKEAPVTVPF